MVERHKPIGSERHHFPPDQEQESIGGREDDRQAEKQDMVQKAEEPDVSSPLKLFQVTERIDGDRRRKDG